MSKLFVLARTNAEKSIEFHVAVFLFKKELGPTQLQITLIGRSFSTTLNIPNTDLF